MNPIGISVVRADETYVYAKYYYYDGPTVYIEVTAINSASSKWRVRGRDSWEDTNVYLEGQGTGIFTFNSDDNYSYILQIQNGGGQWVNTTDVGAALAAHKHSASDMTSGVLGINQGGTGASNGKDALKNLLKESYMILSDSQYGSSLPAVPSSSSDRAAMMGRLFFVKV